MNEVVLTSDFSSSVYSENFDALYHSKHGAIQESKHVFLSMGYDFFIKETCQQSIKILEIGFGTGLNAFLTLLESDKRNVFCDFTTLEAYPISQKIQNQLNYGEKLGEKQLFQRIHSIEWGHATPLTSRFKLLKIKTLFEKYQSDEIFDVIYFDAFAPNTQEHLWEEEMMKKMFSVTKNGSILVTYCAKGKVRRTLEHVGFKVDRIPGPPGKREMIRATNTL